LFRDSLSIYAALNMQWGLPDPIEGLAAVAHGDGHAERAAKLFAIAAVLRNRMGLSWQPFQRETYEPLVTAARAALGERQFIAAWEAGRAMPLDLAIAFAQDANMPSTGERPTASLRSMPRKPERAPGSLSPREIEVVRLVAQGMTNQEIAATLNLSTRTVVNHVANVMSKLGVESRTAVATWAVRQGVA
jgi:DNA-binding CsgD family transcriptional regulator